MSTFATINNRNSFHIVPKGNRHARCGRAVTTVINGPTVAKFVAEGTYSICGTCIKVKAPRYGTAQPKPVDLGVITDKWEVRSKAGHGARKALGRVTASDSVSAHRKACGVPSVNRASKQHGGLSLRRLGTAPAGQEGRTWDVIAADTHRVLARVFADDERGAYSAARKALPFTDIDGLLISRL